MSTDPNTVASYNANAEAYNAHVSDPAISIYHAYYEKPAIYAELPDLHGKEVVSIGCGSGIDAQHLKDLGAARVVGVDISEGMIAIAKREHPDIDFAVMDMEKLDYPDTSFDIAYSSLAIHYLADWSTALKEAHRILKPGGSYIFSCGHPLDQVWERNHTDKSRENLLGTVRDGVDDDVYKILGDYMCAENGGTGEIVGGLADVEVVTYHQTLAKMVHFITAAGFTIEKAVEPLPDERMREISPFNYDKLMKIPSFIIWVLRK